MLCQVLAEWQRASGVHEALGRHCWGPASFSLTAFRWNPKPFLEREGKVKKREMAENYGKREDYPGKGLKFWKAQEADSSGSILAKASWSGISARVPHRTSLWKFLFLSLLFLRTSVDVKSRVSTWRKPEVSPPSSLGNFPLLFYGFFSWQDNSCTKLDTADSHSIFLPP